MIFQDCSRNHLLTKIQPEVLVLQLYWKGLNQNGEACASLSPCYFIFPIEFTRSVWTNWNSQYPRRVTSIKSCQNLCFLALSSLKLSRLPWLFGFLWYQAQAAFLVAGTLNSCMNFMDCLRALSFSKVPLRVMFSFVCNIGMADHCFVGPAVTPESWIGWKIQMQNLS